MATVEQIEAVWARHHIERLPGHDMSNECRLAAVILALEAERDAVVPGSVWKHYKKGDIYMVLAVADYTGSHAFKHEWEKDDDHKMRPTTMGIRGFPEGEKLVVYIGLYDNPHGNRPCTRPLSEWKEGIRWDPLGGRAIPRYARVS